MIKTLEEIKSTYASSIILDSLLILIFKTRASRPKYECHVYPFCFLYTRTEICENFPINKELNTTNGKLLRVHP